MRRQAQAVTRNPPTSSSTNIRGRCSIHHLRTIILSPIFLDQVRSAGIRACSILYLICLSIATFYPISISTSLNLGGRCYLLPFLSQDESLRDVATPQCSGCGNIAVAATVAVTQTTSRRDEELVVQPAEKLGKCTQRPFFGGERDLGRGCFDVPRRPLKSQLFLFPKETHSATGS